MEPTRSRRGASFWMLVVVATIFMSLEPGLFLVTLALGLSLLAVVWIGLLARLLLLDAFGAPPHAPPEPARLNEPAIR